MLILLPVSVICVVGSITILGLFSKGGELCPSVTRQFFSLKLDRTCQYDIRIRTMRKTAGAFMGFFICGMVLMFLNFIHGGHFSSCGDVLTSLTMVPVQITKAYQWVFVLVQISILAITSGLCLVLEQHAKLKDTRSRKIHHTICQLYCNIIGRTGGRRGALASWSSNIAQREASVCKQAIFLLLHIPLVVVTSSLYATFIFSVNGACPTHTQIVKLN